MSAIDDTPSSTIWGERPLPEPGSVERIDIGPLTLWLRLVENEVWMGHRRSGEAPIPQGSEPPEELEWGRWAMAAAADSDASRAARLRLSPALPDRPLVVSPEYPFTLLRKASARIYVRVPIWVRVELLPSARSEASTLQEIPTIPLSETWWGDFTSGELGYWLTTKARRRITDAHFEPHLVINTLQLTNRSNDVLAVEKIAVRVEHLSLFDDAGKLWAEETVVDYLGEDEGSDIRMDDRPPREAEGAREITPARIQNRGFRARTFSRLKAISGFGG